MVNDRPPTTVRFTDEDREILERLQKLTGLDSATAVIRLAIREAEGLAQRIQRAWEATEQEHTEYLKRQKRADEKGFLPRRMKALDRYLGELIALAKTHRKTELVQYAEIYRGAIHRLQRGVSAGNKAQDALDTLWAYVDEWLDETKAAEGLGRT
jgi:hypothetical protein